MLTAALVLGGILLALITLIALVLVMPVRLWIRVDTAAPRPVGVQVQPLGRFGPWIPLAGSKTGHEEAPASATDAPETPDGDAVRKPRRDAGWRRRLGRVTWPDIRALIGGLADAVHLTRLRIDADFGFPDPADTGAAFGLLTPLLYGACPQASRRVALRPVFDGACFAGSGEACFLCRPVDVLGPVLRFGWHVYGPVR